MAEQNPLESNRMWYYAEDGGQAGPEPEQALISMIKAGTITPETLVWTHGMADWTQARKSVLAGHFGQQKHSAVPPAPPGPGGAQAAPGTMDPEEDEWPGPAARTAAQAGPGFAAAGTGEFYQDMTSAQVAQDLHKAWLWMAWLIGAGIPLMFIFIGIFAYLAGLILGLVLLFKFWFYIQDGRARTTPGKAVGFLFIPFFNLYWMFVAFHGLAEDMNDYCASKGIRAQPINPSISLAFCICYLCTMIPYIGLIALVANVVLGIMLYKSFTEATAAIVLAQGDPPRKPQGAGLLIALLIVGVFVVSIIIVGIVAAIVIPFVMQAGGV